MRPQDQALVERNCPIEISSSLAVSIDSFARALVETRALAGALEVPVIVVENAASQLQVGSAQFADMPEYAAWVDWVAHCATRFSQLSGATAVSLRMSHSRHPTCPRFHVDAVRMRLITTLIGPGCEWLRPVDVGLTPDSRTSQTPDPDSDQQMTPGSVGIFKGATFDAATGRGVVHRSPLDRVDRIVMTLDIAA